MAIGPNQFSSRDENQPETVASSLYISKEAELEGGEYPDEFRDHDTHEPATQPEASGFLRRIQRIGQAAWNALPHADPDELVHRQRYL